MLVARAPVRIGLFGGGTDLPSYVSEFGGTVLNAAIRKYFYVIVTSHAGSVQVTSSDYRAIFRHRGKASPDETDDMKLPKAVLDYFGLYQGLNIFLASEVPPGTGLGSSAAVTVGLIKALSTLQGLKLSAREIAELAFKLEAEELGSPGGKQDQYASAFGGVNLLRFSPSETIVCRIGLADSTRQALEERLLLFFMGTSRRSSSILASQSSSIRSGKQQTLDALHEMKRQALCGAELLQSDDVDGFGHLLHEAWLAKKNVASGVTNERIDHWYDAALAAGALGGKVAGAGGGGFLVVLVRKGARNAVASRMESEGLVQMDFRFEDQGASVVFNAMASE